MRWLLILLGTFTLMACAEGTRLDCQSVNLDDFTPEEILMLSKACGTKKPEQLPEALDKRVAIGAAQMKMTPAQFLKTDYGRALLWRDYEERWANRLMLIFSSVVLWSAIGFIVHRMMRQPKSANWVKGKMQVTEWHEIKHGDSGEPWAVAGILLLATIMSCVIYNVFT